MADGDDGADSGDGGDGGGDAVATGAVVCLWELKQTEGGG